MGDLQLVSYDSFGIHVAIPARLRIKMQDSSGLFAATRDQRSTLSIQINPANENWNATESLIRQPLGVDPMMRMKSRIVREGQITTPYSGYERIVEHFIDATGETDFGWLLTMNTGLCRVILEVGDFCPFAEGEALWSKVVQSLRVGDE